MSFFTLRDRYLPDYIGLLLVTLLDLVDIAGFYIINIIFGDIDLYFI